VRRLLVLAVVIGLAVVSCGGEPDTAATAAPTTSAAVAVSTTTVAPETTEVTNTTAASETTTTTSTSTTTTTTTIPSVCPSPVALKEGTLEFAGVAGDFDGDGNPDETLTYQAAPNDWRVRVIFADGGGAETVINHTDDLIPPRPIGGFDADGDGVDEVFVTVGAGASTTLVGLFDVANCVVTRVSNGGVPAVFSIGASVGAGSGLVCPGDGTLRRTFAQRVDDQGNFEGGYEEFTLAGSRLTSTNTVSSTMTGEEAAVLAAFDCGGLVLP
jgi:hypothetical protein